MPTICWLGIIAVVAYHFFYIVLDHWRINFDKAGLLVHDWEKKIEEVSEDDLL